MSHLLIADARQPAPQFAELLRRLTTFDPYGGSPDPAYRAAVDRFRQAFGETK